MQIAIRRFALLVSMAVLLGGFVAGPASAQEEPHMEVDAYPDTVSVEGDAVRFTVDVVVPEPDRPATVTALSSVTFGNIADAANPALTDTGCSVPIEYMDTPGFLGMACSYHVLIDGPPGELTDTVSATIELVDGTETTISDTVVVTISEQLGAIRGTLVDTATGLPIPGIFVWGTCEGCGDFTGAEGMFFFEGVEPGEYRLRSGSATPGGWDPTAPESYRTEYAYEWFDEEPTGPSEPGAGIIVTVVADETTDIRWELSVGGSIEGTVTSPDGAPVPIVDASFWITDSAGSAQPLETGGYVDFSADGSYRLHGLRSGGYVVCVETSYGSLCWEDRPMTETGPPTSGDVVTVGLGEATTGIDFVFDIPGANGDGDGEGEPAGNGGEPTLPFTGTEAGLLLLTAFGLLATGTGTVILSRDTPSRLP
jgi:hypothetical protein